MFKILLLLCSLQLMSNDILNTEASKQITTSTKYNKLSNVGYYGTGVLAFYAASLVLFDKCQESHGKMVGVALAATFGSWLLKETFRDTGLTWIDLKKELEEFKADRDAYADFMEVDLNSSEKTLSEFTQTAYLFPKYYWREMISFSGAMLLFNYMYKALSEQNRTLRVR